ncbi:MAG TPA: multicopper oxidase domain-containing protein, partial [Longimicrobiaceae bacterium]|nr:multicopper oxidase domain-containing protein [Longimicrobiaceae bacterium]
MSMRIRGKVVDESTGYAAGGLRVEAWDADRGADDYIGWGVTREDGSFEIVFNELLSRELFDLWPDLYFRVYHSGTLLLSTEKSILWNVRNPETEITLRIPCCPVQPPCVVRHIYLKIERVPDYSTVRPHTEKTAPHVQYGRDCMRFEGHENGLIPEAEIVARSLTAVVYREYLDSGYLVPKPDKLILADVNEPPFNHRVPGTVIYTRACERLRIHVWNTDDVPHSFHVHGLRYGIDSDGSWPFGTQNHHGVRSDAICPGQTFTYLYDVTDEMRGPWPFHDHTHHHASKIERGLIGGIVVLAPWERPPRCFRYPRLLLEELYLGVVERERLKLPEFRLPAHLLVEDQVHEEAPVLEGGLQEGHVHEEGGGGHSHSPRGGPSHADGEAHTHAEGGASARHLGDHHGGGEPVPVPGEVPPVEDAVALPRQLRADQLGQSAAAYLKGQVHFLEELAVKEIAWGVRCRNHTDHVPVFFHVLSSGESNPVFDSGDLEEFTGFFEFTFGAAGDHEYFCQHHPIMTGTVHVVAGGPATATVNIVDAPAMAFSPQDVTIGVGGTVRWENHSMHHHTVTSREGAALTTHCINGRGFVGNSPTIVGRSGQRIRFYVFNLDTGINWHNFHPHALRWRFAGETIDIRSMGPAESFVVDAEIPPVIILDEKAAACQDPACRPKDARAYRVKGDFVFHCHVHHHMMNGMVGLVRAQQVVWLTDEMLAELEHRMLLPLDDGGNACPDVDPHPCGHAHGSGRWEEVAGAPEVTFMHSVLLPGTDKVLFWGYTRADQSRLWDYSTPAGAYSAPANQPASLPGMDPNTSDMWSAAHTLLNTPEGLALVHGGFSPNRCFTFNPTTLAWARVQDTVHNRFYATTLTLPDGRALTMYGPGVDNVEVYMHGAGWTPPAPLPVSMSHHEFYPWTYVLPDGRLFIAGPHVPTQRFDLTAPAGVESFPTIAGERSTGGEKGTSVLQILRPPDYRPIAVIMAGDPAPAQQTAEQIDLAAPAPAWTALPNLVAARPEQCTATLLPDGRIFLAGGVPGGADGGPCEIYDPRNPAAGWQAGPNMAYMRAYHSSFILLRDG